MQRTDFSVVHCLPALVCKHDNHFHLSFVASTQVEKVPAVVQAADSDSDSGMGSPQQEGTQQSGIIKEMSGNMTETRGHLTCVWIFKHAQGGKSVLGLAGGDVWLNWSEGMNMILACGI